MRTKEGEAIGVQIGPHDNEKVPPFWDLRFEEFGISDGLFRRVDGAGADDDDNSIIVAR